MKMFVWKCVGVDKRGNILKGCTFPYNYKLNIKHQLFGDIKLCSHGFHFANDLSTLCTSWYKNEFGTRIALCEVELDNNTKFHFKLSKGCSDNIKILKVLSYKKSSEIYKNRLKSEYELQKLAFEE